MAWRLPRGRQAAADTTGGSVVLAQPPTPPGAGQMRSQILGSLAALVVLNAGQTSTATLHATPITPTPIRECKVTVSGDSIPIRAEPIIVNAQYTAGIGDSLSASFADSSKI